jgi:hypothetical protein
MAVGAAEFTKDQHPEFLNENLHFATNNQWLDIIT